MKLAEKIALLLCAVPWTGGAAASAPAESHPNVLFIAVDDLNDWIGVLKGHPQVQTPNLDRLARRGVLFANAHCQAPLCNPSRTSLLTGLRPTTTGVYALDPFFRTAPELKNLRTIPQYFSDCGYLSIGIGKIHHFNDVYDPGKALYAGEFDRLGPKLNRDTPLPAKKMVETACPWPGVDWGTFPHEESERHDYKCASWAIEQLGQMDPAGKPFFLAAGFYLPHLPCIVPPAWFERYPENVELPPILPGDRADTPRASWYLHWDLPEPRLTWMDAKQETRNFVRSYLASITFVDAQIGRLLDALEASPHADNTLVVLWGDNGYHLGEKEITGKNSLWDEATQVPLIFAGPGVPSDAVVTAPAELLDIYPTLIELAGLPRKTELDGLSLVPQMRDPTAPRERPAITTAGGPGNHAIRTERYRYIVYADGSEEFYDMHSDPHAWTNLAADAEFRTIKKELKVWVPARCAAPIPRSKNRLSEIKDGVFLWDSQPQPAKAPIPGMDQDEPRTAPAGS